MKALIDGDAIVFRAGFANERVVDGSLISANPTAYALHSTKKIILSIIEKTKADSYCIYLSDQTKSNFRYKVDPNYKSNRKIQKRPEHEQAIREYLIKNYKTIIVSGAEVDDALGMAQYKNYYESDLSPEGWCSTIICSNDKDLDMIPGWHFDIDWGRRRRTKNGSTVLKTYKNKGIYFITDPGFLSLRKGDNGKQVLVGGGKLWFCVQMLMGDKTDGIMPLAKGYGAKKVYNLLKDCKTYENGIKVVWNLYIKEYSRESQPFGFVSDMLDAREAFNKKAYLLWIKRKSGKEEIFNGSLCN